MKVLHVILDMSPRGNLALQQLLCCFWIMFREYIIQHLIKWQAVQEAYSRHTNINTCAQVNSSVIVVNVTKKQQEHRENKHHILNLKTGYALKVI